MLAMAPQPLMAGADVMLFSNGYVKQQHRAGAGYYRAAAMMHVEPTEYETAHEEICRGKYEALIR